MLQDQSLFRVWGHQASFWAQGRLVAFITSLVCMLGSISAPTWLYLGNSTSDSALSWCKAATVEQCHAFVFPRLALMETKHGCEGQSEPLVSAAPLYRLQTAFCRMARIVKTRPCGCHAAWAARVKAANCYHDAVFSSAVHPKVNDFDASAIAALTSISCSRVTLVHIVCSHVMK